MGSRRFPDGVFILPVLICAATVWSCEKGTPSTPAAAEGPGGITLGMDRSEVLQRMLEEVQALQMSGKVRNPYDRGFRSGPDGTLYEVMFYYTGLARGDNEVSDDELVPVLLVDGKVVGWGREEMARLNIQ